MLKSHIFQYGFTAGYNKWIYHGKNANATVSSNVPKQNAGLPKRDEMFDLLDDIISNGAKVDPIGAQSSNVQYNEFFTTLISKLYPGVSSFSLLNFLVKLMHLKVLNKWINNSINELLKFLKLAFPKIDLVDSHYEARKLMTKMGLVYRSIHVCKNDRALFWNENSLKEIRPICLCA